MYVTGVICFCWYFNVGIGIIVLLRSASESANIHTGDSTFQFTYNKINANDLSSTPPTQNSTGANSATPNLSKDLTLSYLSSFLLLLGFFSYMIQNV